MWERHVRYLSVCSGKQWEDAVSKRTHVRTTLARISQPWKRECLPSVLNTSELGPWISPSSASPKGGSSHGGERGTMRAIGNSGPPTLCFCGRRNGRREKGDGCCVDPMASLYIDTLQTDVFIERHSPVFSLSSPRSLALVLVPRPSALRRSAFPVPPKTSL